MSTYDCWPEWSDLNCKAQWICLVKPEGIGLRANTAGKALSRLEGFLQSCATQLSFDALCLTVEEPCSIELADRVHRAHCDEPFDGGALDPSEPEGGLEPLLAGLDHIQDPVAAEAWQRFGTPPRVGVSEIEERVVTWQWHEEQSSEKHWQEWCAFLCAHQRRDFGKYAQQVRLHAWWSFHLKGAGSASMHPTFPPSEVFATLMGRQSSASLDLVFPHAVADEAFWKSFEMVSEALGLKLPTRALRLDAPTKKGRRRRSKL